MKKIKIKKKILFILNVDYFLITHRLPVAIKAIKLGYDVHLASQVSNASEEIKKHNIKVHPIRINRSGLNINSIFLSLLDIYKIIREIEPDIVHLISIKPILLGGLALHFIKDKPKIISSISGLGYLFTNKGYKTLLLKFIATILYKIAFKHKSMICIVQNRDDLHFLQSLTSLPNRNFKLIPGSGVDLKKFCFTELSQSKPIIIFPARLLISKGIQNFIEAAVALKKKARFVIVGKFDPDSRDSITKEYIEFYQNKNFIEYWGYSKRMHLIIPKSTIVVLPSFREGLPKVLCEAAACGRVIITTDVPGCRDSIIKDETGLLIPRDDSSALIRALTKLLDNPENLYIMGKKGRKFAEKMFDVNKIVNQHMKIYQK